MSQHKGIVKNCLWNGLNVKWRITGKSMCFCIIHYWLNVKSRLFFIFCTAGAKHEKRPNGMLGKVNGNVSHA